MSNYRALASGVFASGRTWSTRVHWVSAAPIATVYTDWSAQLSNMWTNGTYGLETLYPATTTLNHISVALLDTVMKESTKVAGNLALPGTGTGDTLPDHDVVLVSLRNAAVGPDNRGRMSLPALLEALVDENIIQSTPATRISTAIGALFTGMRGAGHQNFVYNKKITPRRPVLFTTTVLLTQEVDRVIRSQRRRTAKLRAQYV